MLTAAPPAPAVPGQMPAPVGPIEVRRTKGKVKDRGDGTATVEFVMIAPPPPVPISKIMPPAPAPVPAGTNPPPPAPVMPPMVVCASIPDRKLEVRVTLRGEHIAGMCVCACVWIVVCSYVCVSV